MKKYFGLIATFLIVPAANLAFAGTFDVGSAAVSETKLTRIAVCDQLLDVKTNPEAREARDLDTANLRLGVYQLMKDGRAIGPLATRALNSANEEILAFPMGLSHECNFEASFCNTAYDGDVAVMTNQTSGGSAKSLTVARYDLTKKVLTIDSKRGDIVKRSLFKVALSCN